MSNQNNDLPQSRDCDQHQDLHPNKGPERLQCAGCGSDKHSLSSCLKAGDDGLMRGCPRCNTLSHNASNCRAVKTDKERFIWFVNKRGGMPSFLDFDTWFRLASTEGSLTVHNRFPWTAEFTKFVADDIEQLQNDLDSLTLGVDFKLPEDPKLLGWRAVEMYRQRRVREETATLDGVVKNKKRAAMIVAGDSHPAEESHNTPDASPDTNCDRASPGQVIIGTIRLVNDSR